MASRRTQTFFLLALIAIFFTVSGGCGLLYQVVWTRKLVLLFGTTSHAVSTVLAVFFLGLGLGSWLGGRIADRVQGPLMCYGAIEAVIGLWAGAFILLIDAGEDAAVGLMQAAGGAPSLGIAARGLLAAILILVPVALMGATLPLLARAVNGAGLVRGWRVGGLYTLNTLGAVAGCYITGFYLIEHYGYKQTTLIGAALNIAVGGAALLLALIVNSEEEAGETKEAAAPTETVSPFTLRLVAMAFALSGFCGIALEVFWTRLLSIVFLGTTYAYTTMLTTILAGIALGSLVATLLSDRLRRPADLIALALAASGIGVIYTLRGIAGLPDAYSGADWEKSIASTFQLSFLTLLPATFFLGMTFPLVAKTASAAGHVGRDVGRLYMLNTIAGVFGALAGGYVLLPLIGTHYSIMALGLLLVLSGIAINLSIRRESWSSWKLLTLLSIAGSALVLSSTFTGSTVNQRLNKGYIPEDHKVIHFREGTEGTVAVSEPKNETGGTNRVLWINRVQATTSIEKGVRMNRLQGVLPLLFNRDPKRVLFMCFGSGITCGTLALSPFERIDAVEISPDVLEAAPLFAADNLDVMQRPNVSFHIDDGRNYLLTTQEKYDFITFEPMPLAVAGVSNFYTREYYHLCRARLNPGGMVSQWVPLHSLGPELVKDLVRTFLGAFPEAMGFFINADLFLIGSDQPLLLDYAAAEKRLAIPELRAALEAVTLCDTPEILATLYSNRTDLEAFAGQGRTMTDDRPWAEFEAPKTIYKAKVPDAMRALVSHRTSAAELLAPGSATPEQQAALEQRVKAHWNDFDAVRIFYADSPLESRANDAFRQSLSIDPKDCNARFYLREDTKRHIELWIRWEEFEKADDLMNNVLKFMADDPEIQRLAAELDKAKSPGNANLPIGDR